MEGGKLFYLITIAQSANSCWALEEAADVRFDECRVLGLASQSALSESMKHGQKANISIVSMALFAHPGWRLEKKRRRKQTESRPAVGDDGIRDDLNKNPAAPQSGADGCSTWSVERHSWCGLQKQRCDSFERTGAHIKGRDVVVMEFGISVSNSLLLSGSWLIATAVIIKVKATRRAAVQIGDYMEVMSDRESFLKRHTHGCYKNASWMKLHIWMSNQINMAYLKRMIRWWVSRRQVTQSY